MGHATTVVHNLWRFLFAVTSWSVSVEI